MVKRKRDKLDDDLEELAHSYSLPVPEQIAFRRKRTLERCLKYRGWIKEGDRVVHGHVYTADSMRFMLRKDQMILLRLRIWRSTGLYPSEN